MTCAVGIWTSLPENQPPVFTTSWPITQLRSSTRKSAICPISPSLAWMR